VRTPDPKQRWLTFVHNHANVIVACDFFVVVTATFRTLYVFVIMELGTRRILHHNVTAHPTAEWTLQQFREALPGAHPYRYVIHDRDSIFSQGLDKGVTDLGVSVLRTPVRAPKANSVCERFGGTLRRECVDFLIPLNERHLKMTSKNGVSTCEHATTKYNAHLPRFAGDHETTSMGSSGWRSSAHLRPMTAFYPPQEPLLFFPPVALGNRSGTEPVQVNRPHAITRRPTG
jgi:transposase InsO family protein